MKNTTNKTNGIVVLSLFDGMSCARLALDKVGLKVDKYIASEVKKFAISHTLKQFPNTIMCGDVTKLHYNKSKKTLYANCKRIEKNGVIVRWDCRNATPIHVGKIDLLIGGSPCQQFSNAFSFSKNPFKGLKGKDSKLFYEYLRLLNETNPTYFLLENVKMTKPNKDALDSYLGVEAIYINSDKLTYQHRARYYWTNIKGITNVEDAHVSFKDYKITTLPRLEPILIHNKFNEDKLPLNITSEELNRICNNNLWAYEELKMVNPSLTKEEFIEELHNILSESIAKRMPFRERMWANGVGKGKFVAKNITNEDKVGALTRVQDRNPCSGCIAFGDFYRYLNRLELCKAQGVEYAFLNDLSYRQLQDVLGDGFTIDVIAHLLTPLKKKYASK